MDSSACGGTSRVRRQFHLQLGIKQTEFTEFTVLQLTAACQAECCVKHFSGILYVAKQPLQVCILLPEAKVVAVFWLFEEILG